MILQWNLSRRTPPTVNAYRYVSISECFGPKLCAIWAVYETTSELRTPPLIWKHQGCPRWRGSIVVAATRLHSSGFCVMYVFMYLCSFSRRLSELRSCSWLSGPSLSWGHCLSLRLGPCWFGTIASVLVCLCACGVFVFQWLRHLLTLPPPPPPNFLMLLS